MYQTNKKYFYLVIVIFIINLLLAFPRLLPGLPSGVDSASHLYKIMFMSKSFMRYGYIPEWTPEWYGGMYLFHLYPPLSYYLVFVTAQTGLGPISAYKLVDFLFYLFAPLTIYLLAKEFHLKKYERITALAIFTLSPLIIENLLFYDRFPNIISLPLLCILLILSHRLFQGKFSYFIPTTLLLACIILIHHLSALYSILILFILAAVDIHRTESRKQKIALLVLMIIFAFGISSFWSAPFSLKISNLGENTFFNRNVIDDAYMKITYFSRNMAVYSFGIAHLTLAITSLLLFIGNFINNKSRIILLLSFPILFTSLIFFEVAVKFQIQFLTTLSQMLLLFGFLFLFTIILTSTSRIIKKGDKEILFCTLWFLIFFWFSLGGYAVPFSTMKALPYLPSSWISTVWMSLDVQRFWLFLVIPISILATRPLTRLAQNAFLRKRSKSLIATIILLSIISLGGVIKAYYSLNQPISEHLPSYINASNSEIPPEIITYFQSTPFQGRILNIKSPFWIYLLPYYTDKPLIDGWYPQGKLLDRIVKINDYRINDLEVSNSTQRIQIWKALVSDSEILGINWVIFGDDNQTLQNIIISNSGFLKNKTIEYKEGRITIYQSRKINSLFTIDPIQKEELNILYPTPDTIEVSLPKRKSDINLTIKEAYAPSWRAESDGKRVNIQKSDEGFILIQIPQNIDHVHLYHENRKNAYYLISLVSLLLLFSIPFFLKRIELQKKKL